jgi:Secretion system C-terminal sorting domain/Beta-propeller repeat
MNTAKITLLIILKLFITQANAQMNLEWVKAFGGESVDEGRAISVDGEGNVFSTGVFENTVDFDPSNGEYFLSSAGAYDIFISKLDASGNFLWSKKIGGFGYDVGNSIATDNDGNVYVTGRFNGTVDFDPSSNVFNLSSGELSDLFICKFDPLGNFSWTKQFGGSNLLSFESSNCLTIDDSNNLYITGYFSGIADFDPGDDVFNLASLCFSDAFIVKIDQTGNFVWAKQFSSLNTNIGISSLSIACDSQNNVYTTGYFGGDGIDLDPSADTFSLSEFSQSIFISKLNSSGDFVWGKTYGTVQLGPSSFDEGKSISCDHLGNVYVAGIFYLTNNFGSTNNSDYLTSAGNADIFISKLDSLGNLIWAKRMGGAGDDVAESVAVDNYGNVYTTGYFNGISDFDPSADTINLTAIGYEDTYINKLDALGNFVWVYQFGGNFYERGKEIKVDENNNICTTGSYHQTVDFDPSENTLNLTSTGSSDIFIHKMNQNMVGIIEYEALDGFTLYPNPSSNEVTIGYSLSSLQNVDFGIYDIRGRLVRKIEKGKKQAGKYVLKVDISNLANGIYVIQMRTGDDAIFKKLLKE